MIVANDKRRVVISESNDPSVPDAPVENAEKMFQIVVGTVKSYLRNRAPEVLRSPDKVQQAAGLGTRHPRDVAADAQPKTGIAAALGSDAVIDEMSRYIVQALLTSSDPRPWRLVQAKEVEVGDIFVAYDIVEGNPVDEEVVVAMPPKTSGSTTVIRFRRKSGKISDRKSTVDYLYHVHRPVVSREALQALLGEDLPT